MVFCGLPESYFNIRTVFMDQDLMVRYTQQKWSLPLQGMQSKRKADDEEQVLIQHDNSIGLS